MVPPSPESLASPADSNIWYLYRNPSEGEILDDGAEPDAAWLVAFKAGLKSKLQARHGDRVRRWRLPPNFHINETQAPWALSELPDQAMLPDAPAFEALQIVGLAYMQHHFEVNRFISVSHALQAGLPLDFALASLGAVLTDHQTRRALWLHASQRLYAAVVTDNRRVRIPFTFLTWQANLIAACMSSDRDLWRLATIANGFWETAFRRSWMVHQLQPVPDLDSFYCLSMLRTVIQIDLVRALTTGCMPSIALSLGWVSGRQTLDALGQSASQTEQVEDGLFRLLLLLNDILTSAMISDSLCLPLQEDDYPIVSTSPGQEISKGRIRVFHALELWREKWFASSSSAIRALYHFCRIFNSMPNLHTLSQLAENSRTQGRSEQARPSLARSQDVMHDHRQAAPLSTQSGTSPAQTADVLADVSRHAWLLHDHVRLAVQERKDRSTEEMFLPIITYLTALCVWKMICDEKTGSGTQGSKRVLLLYQQQLLALPWAGCRAMADCLLELSMQ